MIAGSTAAMLSAQGMSSARPRSEPLTVMAQLSPPIEQAPTLLTAPIELAGDWGHMLPYSADQVVERMRHACLDGIRLVSDRQPTRLRVDEHTSGYPQVWLHPDGSTMAWIIVDIGQRDWSKLAYQFGHELGHVMANSWQPHAKPKPPCQWLEEALVEAFSNSRPGPPGGKLEAGPALPRHQCIRERHSGVSPGYYPALLRARQRAGFKPQLSSMVYRPPQPNRGAGAQSIRTGRGRYHSCRV